MKCQSECAKFFLIFFLIILLDKSICNKKINNFNDAYKSKNHTKINNSTYFKNTTNNNNITNRDLTAEKRIFNIETSKSGEFPWTVAIQYQGGLGFWMYMCNGAIIHEYWVLTSSACIRSEQDSSLRVVAGCQKLALMWDNDEYLHKVGNYYYYSKELYDDIALLVVNNHFDFENNNDKRPVELIQMYDEDDLPTGHVKAFVSGYKKIVARYDDSDRELRSAQTLISSRPVCGRLLGGDILTNIYMCGMDDTPQERECKGHSGGPLVALRQTEPRRFYLFGINSNQENCTDRSSFDVFTRVRHYLPWISETLAKRQHDINQYWRNKLL